MSFRKLILCGLFAIQVFSGRANLVAPSTADDFVMTPGGLISKENIHSIPNGGSILKTETEVHLMDADGSIIHSAPISKTASLQSKIVPARTKTSVAARALSTGYVAYSYWNNTGGSNIASFSTSFVVPPVPAKKDGQILYIFNGLVPNSFDSILQPVLQFGDTPAGGGNFWAVASWFVTETQAFYTNPAQVKVGQTLTGKMTLLKTTGTGAKTSYQWNSIFNGISSSSLTMGSPEPLSWAYEALEIYSASGDSDLPKGTTMMTDINIVTQDGKNPVLNWTAVSDSTDGFKMEVVSSASTNGAMQITYP